MLSHLGSQSGSLTHAQAEGTEAEGMSGMNQGQLS